MRSKQQFLDEVFCADGEYDSRLLENTLHYVSRRKRRRHVVHTAALALVLGCAALFAFLPKPAERVTSQPSAPATTTARVVPGTHIRLLTDEELLRMFAGRPVALVGSGDQRQFVVLDTLRQPTTHTVN